MELNKTLICCDEILSQIGMTEDLFLESLLSGQFYPYDAIGRRYYCWHLDEEINGIYRVLWRYDNGFHCIYDVNGIKKLYFKLNEFEKCIEKEYGFEPTITQPFKYDEFLQYVQTLISQSSANLNSSQPTQIQSRCIENKDIMGKTPEEIIAHFNSNKNGEPPSDDDKPIIAYVLLYGDNNLKMSYIGELLHNKRGLRPNTYGKFAKGLIDIAKSMKVYIK